MEDGLPRLVRALAEQYRELPRFVTREFESYPGCRDPTKGFAWLECPISPLRSRSCVGVLRQRSGMHIRLRHQVQVAHQGAGDALRHSGHVALD